jgi:ABC-type molybdate transport system substrate-binding protein
VALLPRSLTLGPGLREGRVVAIGEALAPPVAQSGVILAGAREPALARAFLDFLGGEKGRAILSRSGYAVP